MKKGLFVSANPPVSNAKEAGSLAAFRHLLKFSEHFETTVITFARNHDEMDSVGTLVGGNVANVICILISKRDRVAGIMGRPDLPLLAGSRSFTGFREAIDSIDLREISWIHLEWSQIAFWALDLGIPFSVTVHDVLTDWAAKRAFGPFGSLWDLESVRSFEYEKKIYRAARMVFCLSSRDGEIIQKSIAGTSANVKTIGIGGKLYSGPSVDVLASSSELKLVMWGAMNRYENEEAALWIYYNLLPKIRLLIPGLMVTILGANPSDRLRSLTRNDFCVSGYVVDPGDVLKNCQIALAPLSLGAGLKVKVIESLAAGIPTICTAVAAEGISATSGDGLFVLPRDPNEIIRVICRLWGHRHELVSSSLSAAKWAAKWRTGVDAAQADMFAEAVLCCDVENRRRLQT